MKRKIYLFALSFILSYNLSTAQEIYLDPGVGLYFNSFETETSKNSFTAFRANLGVHNLIAKRLGFYITAEVTPNSTDPNNSTYVREIVGGNIRINNYLSIFGGMGLMDKGLLGNNLKNVRKEVGAEITMFKNRVSLDLGISGTGPSVTVGYIIPAIFHAGEKTVEDKKAKEKKQADDLTSALKQVDEVKANSAKELSDVRKKLSDTEAALRNAEAARIAAENAAKQNASTAGPGGAIESRAVARARAIEAVSEVASKSKGNFSGATSLLNGAEMVTFKYGAADLSKGFMNKLDQLKNFLDQSPAYSILVTGHACDLGEDEANQVLSEARSEAVRKYLVGAGLSPNRVLTKGMGERAPIVPNNTESNRRKNRRVDFTLLNN